MIIRSNCVDVTEKVNKALLSGETNIEFEKGEYHFYPEKAPERESYISNHDNDGCKKVGVQIENKSCVMINGGGSRFVFHGIMLPFGIERCRDISLCNFSIDFPISTYIHSTILDADENSCTVKLWDNTPYRMNGDTPLFLIDGGYEFEYGHAMEFNPELECVEYGTNDRDYFKESKAEEIEKGILKIRQKFNVIPKKGNYMFFSVGKRFAPAIFINFCDGVKIENVTVHHALGMGLLAQLSKNIQISRMTVSPSSGRFVSTFADAAHFVECMGSITINQCCFEKQMDDALNCHGIYAQIEKADKNRAQLRLKHRQALGINIFSAGDRVEYINPENLLSYGSNTVKSASMKSNEIIEIEFENNIEAINGHYIENISHTPNLTVKNSYFGKNRARGLLITTRGKVIAENNVFEKTGAAIRISGDANFWYESGCVKDVTVKNNTFIDCNANARWGNSVIDIAPQVLKPAGPVHRNIRVEGNKFKTFDIPLLWANCAENLFFTNNKIEKTNTFPPKGIIKEMVTLQNCIETTVENNQL